MNLLRQILARRRLAAHTRTNRERMEANRHRQRDARGRFWPGIPSRNTGINQ